MVKNLDMALAKITGKKFKQVLKVTRNFHTFLGDKRSTDLIKKQSAY